MSFSSFRGPAKKYQTRELWSFSDLDHLAAALVPQLRLRGKIWECGRMSNTSWAIVWVDLGRVCRLVVSRWAYPGLWRMHANLPQSGDLYIGLGLIARLGLNPHRLPDSPRPSELTCTGPEMVDLAGAAIQLTQGEVADSPALPWLMVPGVFWTPAADAVLGAAEWTHHREHWVKRRESGPSKVEAS